MMLSTRLVCTLVVFVTIGSVVMALPAPQFRFGMPAHFSYRTVHTPQHSQAPNTFFFRQPRLTSMATKAFNNLEAPQVQQTQSSPALTEETHVPVFVPVQSDFQGDSVVVSSDDLVNIGLTGALENTIGTVDPAPAALDEGTPFEDLSLAPVADIQTESQDAVNIEESATGSLSTADDAFVLTASEAQPEPVDLVSPVDSVIEPEAIQQEVQPAEPAVLQTFDTTTTVSPFHTETFKAYNQFMNTWIQLASVNLNRPELLKLVNFQPTPQALIQAHTEPEVLEILESVVPEAQPEAVVPEAQPEVVVPEAQPEAVVPEAQPEAVVPEAQPEALEPVEAVEAVQPLETSESKITEIVEESPVVEETLPVETVTEDIVSDFTSADVTTELPLAEVTTEVTGAYAEEEEVIPVTETIPEVTFENLQPEVIKPAVEVIKPAFEVIKPVSDVVEQDIVTNIIPDTPVYRSANIPDHPNTIPTYTSRGRLSGFRYSYSHVPQKGTFFINSFTG